MNIYIAGFLKKHPDNEVTFSRNPGKWLISFKSHQGTQTVEASDDEIEMLTHMCESHGLDAMVSNLWHRTLDKPLFSDTKGKANGRNPEDTGTAPNVARSS